AGFLTLMFTFDLSLQRYSDLFHDVFRRLSQPSVSDQDVHAAVYSGLTSVLLLTLPVAGAAAAIGALADLLQVGPLLVGEPLIPKLEKLNPVQGLKNLVSKKQ